MGKLNTYKKEVDNYEDLNCYKIKTNYKENMWEFANNLLKIPKKDFGKRLML